MLSEVLEGIERRIAGLETAMATSQAQTAAAVSRAVEALAPRLERQSDKDAKLQASVHVLGDRLAAIESVLTEAPVRGIETRLGAVEAVLEGSGDATAARLDRLHEDLIDRLDAIQPFDRSFYPAIHAVADRLSESDDIVAVAMEDVRRLIDERLDPAVGHFVSASIVEMGSAHAAGHSDVLAALADVNRHLIDLPAQIDGAGDGAEAVLAAVAELRERMAKPRPIDEGIKAAVKRMTERIGELEERTQGRGASGDDEINATVTALGDRLDGLQSAVDVLGSRVGHSHAEIATDVRAAMATAAGAIGRSGRCRHRGRDGGRWRQPPPRGRRAHADDPRRHLVVVGREPRPAAGAARHAGQADRRVGRRLAGDRRYRPRSTASAPPSTGRPS